jgi:hypothetical protein
MGTHNKIAIFPDPPTQSTSYSDLRDASANGMLWFFDLSGSGRPFAGPPSYPFTRAAALPASSVTSTEEAMFHTTSTELPAGSLPLLRPGSPPSHHGPSPSGAASRNGSKGVPGSAVDPGALRGAAPASFWWCPYSRRLTLRSAAG